MSFIIKIWLLSAGLVVSAAAGELLPNGDFEKADPADARRPLHWDLPDGLGVQWTTAEDPAHGKAIRVDTTISELRLNEQWTKMGMTNTWFITKAADNPVAETYGLSFYSDAIPVKSGQPYRVSFEFKGPGGGKVWVRCYNGKNTEKHRLYEKLVFCEKSTPGWTRYAEVFYPTKFRPAVTELRIMLYAYYPAKVYWFDNVAIDPITEAEYDQEKKAVAER